VPPVGGIFATPALRTSGQLGPKSLRLSAADAQSRAGIAAGFVVKLLQCVGLLWAIMRTNSIYIPLNNSIKYQPRKVEMKKTVAIVLAIMLTLSLSACNITENGSGPDQIQSSSVAEPDSDTQYPNMILTKEQMLQDYDAMWSTMEESYPFFGVIDRRIGNPDSYKVMIENYRSQIEDMTLQGDEAMWEYIGIIAGSLYEITDDPHVSIINPNHYRSNIEMYKEIVNEMPEAQSWLDALGGPEIASLYEYYDYLIQKLVMQEQGDEQQSESVSDEDAQSQWEEEFNRLKETNLTTEILDEGKTAYIKVASFDNVFLEHDIPRIHAFMEEVKDYENLIIDIAENGGGSSTYWEEAFVRPNLAEPATESYVRLMKDTKLAQRFYGSFYNGSAPTIDAIKSNPHYTALPTGDLTNLTLVREITSTTEPASGEKLFQGKIWVLTGPSVYSTAENFVLFCKSTGFATLVGKTTGGGNTGGPIIYELPVSHILIQFDVEYCLNPDGSCSQELGTVPDIDAEDALQETLNRIRG